MHMVFPATNPLQPNTHQTWGNFNSFSIPRRCDKVWMSPVNPCGVQLGLLHPPIKADKAQLTLSRLRMVAIWERRANLSRIVQVVTVVR